MNVLYIAMGCAPNSGSEDKIGWDLSVECAKTNNVFVITIEKQREAIEAFLKKNKLEKIRFYYVDIPEIYKKIFTGFLFSGRLNPWHRRAFPVAREICAKENIQIIHQITPVEFRSIGKYGKIPNVKFICGPVGGAELTPLGLKDYSRSNRHIEQLRNIANLWYRFWLNVSGRLGACDLILFANHETKEYLRKYIPVSKLGNACTEIGISSRELESIHHRGHRIRRFLVVGRLIYRKGHDFLLDALNEVPDNEEYECVIIGDGPEGDKLKNRVRKERKLYGKVNFVGNISYDQVETFYRNADVLIMPSIRETTGTVVLEAMSKGLPVITINKFGGATILDNETGWLFEGNTKEEYIQNLRKTIEECIHNLDEVLRRGQNAKKRAEDFIWQKKMECYQKVYEDLTMDGE